MQVVSSNLASVLLVMGVSIIVCGCCENRTPPADPTFRQQARKHLEPAMQICINTLPKWTAHAYGWYHCELDGRPVIGTGGMNGEYDEEILFWSHLLGYGSVSGLISPWFLTAEWEKDAPVAMAFLLLSLPEQYPSDRLVPIAERLLQESTHPDVLVASLRIVAERGHADTDVPLIEPYLWNSDDTVRSVAQWAHAKLVPADLMKPRDSAILPVRRPGSQPTTNPSR